MKHPNCAPLSTVGFGGRKAPQLARFVRVALCVAALASSIAFGQTARGTSDTLHHIARPDTTHVAAGGSDVGWCFEPRPQAKCRRFWITEFNGYGALVSSHFVQQTPTGPFTLRDLPGHGSVSIGGMANHGPITAFGGAATFGGGTGGKRFGVEVRARRWLAGNRAIDMSAGPLWASVHAHSLSDHTPSRGVGVDVSLIWFDWVGLTGRGEVLRAEGRNLSAIYGGVRLGTYPAVVVTSGFVLLWSLVTLSGGPGS